VVGNEALATAAAAGSQQPAENAFMQQIMQQQAAMQVRGAA